MEAASVPRSHRRFRPTWKAPVALALYLTAAWVAWSLVAGAGTLSLPSFGNGQQVTQGAIGPNPSDLALTTIATRASRSVVEVGAAKGFVAWTANGLSLVLTARPAGGWQTGDGRSVTVAAAGTEYEGTLVRADPKTGLGLVRVRGDLGRPLWQQRAATELSPGDRVAIAARPEPQLFSVAAARHNAIRGAPAGADPGQPVLAEDGRVVGVTTGGRVVPIGRACGPIRRC